MATGYKTTRARKAVRENILKKFVYFFDEGGKEMTDLLGGKGAHLAEMTRIGIPVPFGFTISTEVCAKFLENGKYPEIFGEQLQRNLEKLERKTGKKFGSKENPLLISVRSGAARSMPGMMDTILNLGLNDETVDALAEKTANERFAYDCYRRFIQMFGDVVLNVKHEKFEEALEKLKIENGVDADHELGTENLKKLVEIYKKIVEENTGAEFPKNPLQQLKLSIEAVFNSWNNDRAKTYRKLHDITGLKGTAVNIQAMVFGNMGEDCGTGVAFTRNPSTGERELYGEFLINAQGEDVVAGIRTPRPILELETVNSEALEQLLDVRELLEAHYRDMQDIEFTIEKGKLFLLQTRSGKRTAGASVRIACDMVDEGLISKKEALLKVEAKQLNQLLHSQIKKTALRDVVTKGLPASPGAACGKVVFTSERAIELVEKHEKVVLVRKETSPEDLSGMNIAEGILTARGGMTSHAAVVCRGMGKCCITGAKEIIVNESAKKLIIGEIVINEGDILTLDGGTGEVMQGEMEMQKPEISGDLKRILEWADEVRTLRVRTNADTPHDSEVAVKFGAEGIGLCRTEHMFFEEDRIHLVRQMILAKSQEERKTPLEKLLQIQKSDFTGIFQVMKGLPITVRLLDPPLHEFLPEKEDKIEALAKDFGVSVSEIRDTINSLKEVNPMMGLRGVRLGITFPDIYEMQVKAIAEAAIHVTADGTDVNVEIEIPLVGNVREFTYMRELVEKTIAGYGENIKFKYKIGTMIELPRACLIGDELAKVADFFSFGTNDLTQMTYGLSRDDMGKFIPEYIEKGILERDPAATIDKDGVGKLMKACVMLGRSVKRDLEIGICGEHGGDPESIRFCHEIGLDYVSCSPYRVPIARLAAAQAALR